MSVPSGTLTDEQEAELVAELQEALDLVLRTSGCADMHPLWMIATKRPRAEFLRHEGVVTGVPEHLRGWRGPKRSKYAALAHWRHVVLWKGALQRLQSDRARAVEDMYFTPYDRNEPPYAWSKASRHAPAASRYPSPTAFDAAAKAGCGEAIELLIARAEPKTLADEARNSLADLRPRLGSLHDVLRTG